MAKFIVDFGTDNAAFHEREDWQEQQAFPPGPLPQAEVARILRQLADDIEDGGNYFNLFDINGNKVGFAEYRLSND